MVDRVLRAYIHMYILYSSVLRNNRSFDVGHIPPSNVNDTYIEKAIPS